MICFENIVIFLGNGKIGFSINDASIKVYIMNESVKRYLEIPYNPVATPTLPKAADAKHKAIVLDLKSGTLHFFTGLKMV